MKYVKLGDMCEVLNGFAFKSDKYVNKGIRVIRITNVQKGFVEDESPAFYPQSEESNVKQYILNENDLLISLTGNVGRVAVLTKEFLPAALNQRVGCIRIKKEDLISREYLFTYLNSDLFENDCIFSAKGIAQKNMSTEWLKNYEIPVYEKEKQTLISESVFKVLKIIQNYKKQLEKYDTLIKSRFIEMFGDILAGKYKFETRKLGEISEVGSSHRVFTTEFVEHGIPFYRGTEIGELANGKIPQEPYYISEEHYQRLIAQDSKPQIGDLLMPSICNKGQVWMVDTEEPFYYKDGRVLSISPNREIYNSKYLQYFMREKTLVEYPKLGSGSTFAEFKIFLLKDIDILTPPLSLQNDFATFVQQVDKSKFEIANSLKRLYNKGMLS